MPSVKEIITSLTILAQDGHGDLRVYFNEYGTGNLLSPGLTMKCTHDDLGEIVILSNMRPNQIPFELHSRAEVLDLRKEKQQ